MHITGKLLNNYARSGNVRDRIDRTKCFTDNTAWDSYICKFFFCKVKLTATMAHSEHFVLSILSLTLPDRA